MSPSELHIISASLGASVQEVIHWYDLREHLAEAKYKKLLRSGMYWTITLLMIVVSALGTLIWFEGAPSPDVKTYMLIGAAFPLLFKKVAKAKAQTAHLGVSPASSSIVVLKEYFSRQ